MTPVSEAVERDEHWRAHALRGDRLCEEKDAQIARLTEQVRVAREGLEAIAEGGFVLSAAPAQARETLTRMERTDD
jgi:hypothetical protein